MRRDSVEHRGYCIDISATPQPLGGWLGRAQITTGERGHPIHVFDGTQTEPTAEAAMDAVTAAAKVWVDSRPDAE